VIVWLLSVENVIILWVGHLGYGCFFEMELSFIVESKTFVFSVLDEASTLRVGEKRKSFSRKIFISSSCSEWLALTL
jgi:hypothetical protein